MSIPTEEFCDLIHRRNISPRVIVEIGTLHGDDTKILARHFPDSRLVAIDANPDCLPPLKEIPCEPYITVIAQTPGERRFYMKTELPNLSGLYDRGSAYAGRTETRQCVSLNQFCRAHEIHEVNILKIDAEGSTWDILVGMEELLHTVQMMHVETEDYPFFEGQKLHNEVCHFLTSNGFSPLVIEGVDIPPGRQYDSVWIHRSVLHGVP